LVAASKVVAASRPLYYEQLLHYLHHQAPTLLLLQPLQQKRFVAGVAAQTLSSKVDAFSCSKVAAFVAVKWMLLLQELQQDPATFNPQDSGSSDRGQGGRAFHALGGRGLCAPLSLNLEEALEFLREMQ
jgi:hypothetical protein